MFESDFAELFVEQVRLSPLVSQDPYGFETYGTAQLVYCHIEGRQQLFTDRNGETRSCTGRAFMAPMPALHEDWKMEVPDMSVASGWRTVSIAAITTRYDDQGTHHYVVYYGERGNRGMSRNA